MSYDVQLYTVQTQQRFQQANDLDFFEEIRLASFIAKPTAEDPTALPAKQVLAMATRIGAQAIHMDHITGSLEAGKRADLILVDINVLHNQPHFHREPDAVYARIIYASKSTSPYKSTQDFLDHRLTSQNGDEDLSHKFASPFLLTQ